MDLLKWLKQAELDWQTTGESAFVFEAKYLDRSFRLRLNDFPDEPLCTVVADGEEIDLHKFPLRWTLPRHRA